MSCFIKVFYGGFMPAATLHFDFCPFWPFGLALMLDAYSCQTFSLYLKWHKVMTNNKIQNGGQRHLGFLIFAHLWHSVFVPVLEAYGLGKFQVCSSNASKVLHCSTFLYLVFCCSRRYCLNMKSGLHFKF